MGRYTTENGRNCRNLRVGPGLIVPIPFVGTVDLDPDDELGDSIASVVMEIDLIDGVLQPYAVTVTAVDGEPVTGVMLRRVPVQQMAATLIGTAVEAIEWTGEELHGFRLFDAAPFALTPEECEWLRDQGPVEESLRMVANLYELAKVTGRPPAKFVEDTLGIPRPTVTRWVRRAREEGYINGEHR